MAEKMTWIELRRAIMVRSGGNQKEISSFMDELVKQLIAGLRTDKVVRISGLGSFKMQTVAPRKSVNVATGEDIVIPGYEKVAFVPESGVKELVMNLKEATEEKPEPATPLQKLGAQADEIVGLLADLGQAPKKVDEPAIPQTPETPEIPETPEKPDPKVEPEPIVAPEPVKAPEPVAPVVTPVVEPVVAPVVAPEPVAPVVTPVVEPVKEPEKEPVKELEKEPEKEPEKPKYHFLRDTLITLTILLLLLAGAFYFFRQELTKWVDSLREKMQTPVEQVVEPVVTDTTAVVDIPQEPDTIATDTIAVEEVHAEEAVIEEMPVVEEQKEEPVKAEEVKAAPEEPQYKEGDVIATVRLRKGEDLSKIARRYYGHGDLWVFIYQFNEDHLGDPDNVAIGSRIKVPYLTPEQRDITNPKTKQQIHELYQQYLQKN
ncbi:MAG: HU family DNA-binding protein [Paludibacteraceae bacterium]|nr:HU family DNA-binding protein [Paludibacteraceae bacterium]